jgi:serine O-acetyltransferase
VILPVSFVLVMRESSSRDLRTWFADIRADHRQLQASRAKYDARFDIEQGSTTVRAILVDFLTHIGFQQMVVFRGAAALHRRKLTPAAMVLSRMIRHLYGAEMHYAADIAPGVMLVHGNGVVVSREAQVGPGCVLSQHVTLGISRNADGVSGAPHLVADVHVGPGAVLIGPITVGPDVKVGPNAVITSDVGPGTAVVAAESTVVARRSKAAVP